MANQTAVHKLQQNPFPLTKAKFSGKCSMTQLPVAAGELVFYNPETKTVQNAIKIFANTEGMTRTSSFMFKIVEAIFDDWITYQPSDTKEQYFGSFEEMNGESYVSKKGAIQDAIEGCLEEMQEYELEWAWLNNLDVEVGFQI